MNAENAKIAIYGAGAMGTVLGGLLVKGGLRNVTLITRNEEHVKGLAEQGAQIALIDGGEWKIPVRAATPADMGEGYDVVFLMTKQRFNADILEFLLPKLKTDGIVCTTQNGLPEESVAKIVGRERTFGGVASFGANMYGGGRVALTSKFDGMRMQIGGLEKNAEKLSLLAEILSYAGKAVGNGNFVEITENLAGARWSKLAINAAFSGLSVVTGWTFGTIAKKNRSKKIALGVLRECLAVAAALGVTPEKTQGHDMQKLLGGGGVLKTAFALLVLPLAMRKHKALRSGMLRDVENGRKCEIDYINGAVIRAGEAAGVAVPLCERIVELVHGVENGLYEISPENLDFFEI